MSERFTCKECGGNFDIEDEYTCEKCGDSICYWCACDLGRTGGNLTICNDCMDELSK